MTRVFVFFIFILFAIALILSVFSFFSKHALQLSIPFGPTPTPVGSPTTHFNAIDYGAIFLDPQIAQSVKQTLQNPISSTKEAGFTVIAFPTDVSERPNTVYETDGNAKYVLQQITSDNTFFADFVQIHQQDQGFQMYDAQNSGSGFSWYVYPQDGVAYLANKSAGFALQILYFPPTTQGDFLNTTAKTFSLLQIDPDANDVKESVDKSP